MNPKHSRQLGAILRSVPAATAMPLAAEESSTRGSSNDVPSVTAEGSPVAALAGVASAAAPPAIQAEDKAGRSVQGEVPLQITVPKHVRKRLLIMATEQDCSMRALILKAVQSLGVEVDEEELRDKRRKS